MLSCDDTNTTAYKRKKNDMCVQEISSSVSNLISTTDSCETLPGDHQLDTVSTNDIPSKKIQWASYKGFLYTFLCSFFITLSSVIVKKMTYISTGELSLVRNIGVLLGNYPIIVYNNLDPLGPKSHRLLLLVRSFLGATALYLNLLAYRLLPLSEAAIIMSTLPAMVLVMARIFLKEPCGIVQGVAVLFTFAGVLLSIRLPELLNGKGVQVAFTSEDIAGVSCGAGCVLLLSVTFVAIRKMKDVHFSIVMIYLGLIGAIENAGLTAVLSYYTWPNCGLDVLWLLLIAFFGFLGNSALTLAIQTEAVGIVSVLKASIDIIMAMILQMVFFLKPPDNYSIYGALLVLVSVTIIGIRKWLNEKPENSKARQRLRVFLF